MTFVCFGHIRHPVGITLYQLLISILTAAGYQDHLFARLGLHIHAVTILILSLAASSLKVIQQSVSIAVQDIQLCSGIRYTSHQMNFVLMCFQKRTEDQCCKYVLSPSFTALRHVEPAVKTPQEIFILSLTEWCRFIHDPAPPQNHLYSGLRPGAAEYP